MGLLGVDGDDLAGATVSVDLDDVCFDFVDGYAAWRHSERLPSFDPAAIGSYRFAEACGITAERNRVDMDAFVASDAALGLAPIAGCGDAVAGIVARGATVVVVTNRPTSMADGTMAWVAAWLPTVDDVHLLGGTGVSKAQRCDDLGAAAHLDDNPAHLAPMAAAVCRPVLFGGRPWATPGAWPAADGWAHAAELLAGEAAAVRVVAWHGGFDAATFRLLADVHAATGYPDLDAAAHDGGVRAWMGRLPFTARFVAVHAGRVVGHVGLVVPTAGDAAVTAAASGGLAGAGARMVTRFFVAPDVAGRGVGAALLDAARRSAAGAPLLVSVEPHRARARALYEAAGAVEVGHYTNRAGLELVLYSFADGGP